MSRLNKENCNTTLNRLFNKDIETVLKLSINTKDDVKLQLKKSRTTETDLIELHRSIQKVKVIMPSIMTIMNKSVREEKTEDIIYQRFEHIGIENDLKNEIEEINKQINEKKEKKNEKLNTIALIDDEINNIELDINLLSNPEKFTLINVEKNEMIKEINEKNENIKSAKIQKKKLKKHLNTTHTSNNDNDEMNISNFQTKTSRFNDINEFELFLYKKKNENEKKAKLMKEELKPKFETKEKLNTEIKEIDSEIEKLKNAKRILKDKLYIHYLKLLKEGKDTRNEAVSWRIKEIY